MQKFKKNDLVIVVKGKSKGIVGKILSVKKEENIVTKVLVENANKVKRHTKGNASANIPSNIVEKEAYISVANVRIYNPVSKRPDKVKFQALEGKMVRVYRSDMQPIEVNI